MKRILIWLTNTSAWSWLLLKVLPFIRFSTYYTDFSGRQFHLGYALLKTGDIILTKDKRKMTTLLVGGTFTHAALCVDGNCLFPDGYEVAEMTHHNYTKSWFFDICKESDRVVILRCKDFDETYIAHMIEKCRSFSDCQYDVEFDLGTKALYCSELVYQSDFESRLQVDLEDVKGLGRKYVSPTDLYEAENVSLIYDSDDYV